MYHPKRMSGSEQRMPTSESRTEWAQLFGALASEPRLRIIELIARGTVPCREILDRLGLSQPAISYHLSKLERAGIISKERIGGRNCYRLRPALEELFRFLLKEDVEWNTR